MRNQILEWDSQCLDGKRGFCCTGYGGVGWTTWGPGTCIIAQILHIAVSCVLRLLQCTYDPSLVIVWSYKASSASLNCLHESMLHDHVCTCRKFLLTWTSDWPLTSLLWLPAVCAELGWLCSFGICGYPPPWILISTLEHKETCLGTVGPAWKNPQNPPNSMWRVAIS